MAITGLNIRNDISELAAIESWAEKLAGAHHLDEQMTYKINLVLEEIFTNIVFYNDKKDISIAIKAGFGQGTLVLEVIDNGKPFNPLTVNNEPHSVDSAEREAGGLGVLIVKKLSKSMEYKYQNRKNHLKIYFDV